MIYSDIVYHIDNQISIIPVRDFPLDIPFQSDERFNMGLDIMYTIYSTSQHTHHCTSLYVYIMNIYIYKYIYIYIKYMGENSLYNTI